ncbi:ABC transporter ATP-binding protein [Betaproteobacteria bacterium]|nr:ABC transporter ATP-binding protein [Betaproteobacteria bacterium]GHT93881.1 ABC transporter ATP-binding protein [Betaproteobacteria bacterium]GHT98595.1 ABC transporter ATP-binding protein [Betaproteobacteria bacterium]GHU00883.1 ABC transporter ATP-binding protein [Betaproteobacteria bacterium]GHU10744.1 ABC transporter ATP-binding protein [Betaproteobacteria bacterium]
MVAVLRKQDTPAEHAPAASATGTASRIQVEQVSHGFNTPTGPLGVLEDVSLDIAPGEFVALLGPSGCGKSTLLRLVAGLEPATAGTITQDGTPITRPDPSRIVVFQDPTLFPWRTVWNNVALGPEAQKEAQRYSLPWLRSLGGAFTGSTTGSRTPDSAVASQKARVDAALQKVGLESFAKSYPHQLSGGMAQRVALARALVNNPRLLILDEPLGKLDSLTRLELQSELVSLWQKNGFSVLLVTHDVEEALFLAQRLIIFSPRPAKIIAEIAVDQSYPRHRGDPALARLRHEVLNHLGLGTSW